MFREFIKGKQKKKIIIQKLIGLLDVVRIVILMFLGAGTGMIYTNKWIDGSCRDDSIGRVVIELFVALAIPVLFNLRSKAIKYARRDSSKHSLFSSYLAKWGFIMISYPVFYKYVIESIMIFGFTTFAFSMAVLMSVSR